MQEAEATHAGRAGPDARRIPADSGRFVIGEVQHELPEGTHRCGNEAMLTVWSREVRSIEVPQPRPCPTPCDGLRARLRTAVRTAQRRTRLRRFNSEKGLRFGLLCLGTGPAEGRDGGAVAALRSAAKFQTQTRRKEP
jgi:hypothetical protein